MVSIDPAEYSRNGETVSDSRILQRFGLASIYYATNAVNQSVAFEAFRGRVLSWTNENNWVTAADECTWFGIVCDSATSNIISIDFGNQDGQQVFQGNRLSGFFPAEGIHYVRNTLRALILIKNPTIAESPGIDPFLGSLSQLEVLLISETGFRGSNGLPTVFGQLPALRTIAAADTLYTGQVSSAAIPQSIEFLDIQNNGFDGSTIPRAVTARASLESLFLGFSNFAEPNLNFFSNMASRSILRFLWLDGNDIRGTLPQFFFRDFPALISFSVTETLLTGSLPAAVNPASLSLEQLFVFENAFTGAIPPSYANLPLNIFQFEFNLFDTALGSSGLCELGINEFALTGDCCICPSPSCCFPCAPPNNATCAYDVGLTDRYIPRACLLPDVTCSFAGSPVPQP